MTPRQIADAIVCNVLDAMNQIGKEPVDVGGAIILSDREHSAGERSIILSDAVLEAMDEMRLSFAPGPLDRRADVPRGPGEPPAPVQRCDKPPDEELKAESLREVLEGKL